ncbi:MAG: spore coat associated protein CotJA [Ruminococcus sp.]|nr:spore coat associated protein CotJA [Ruminococcus sp.]
MEKTDKTLLGALLSDDDVMPEAAACPMPRSVFPADMPLAMAYVPFQTWQKTYDSDAALSRGTLFPCLDLPFIGEEAARNDK